MWRTPDKVAGLVSMPGRLRAFFINSASQACLAGRYKAVTGLWAP
jgi:hypothetical protein